MFIAAFIVLEAGDWIPTTTVWQVAPEKKKLKKLGRCDSYLQSETINDPLTDAQG